MYFVLVGKLPLTANVFGNCSMRYHSRVFEHYIPVARTPYPTLAPSIVPKSQAPRPRLPQRVCHSTSHSTSPNAGVIICHHYCLRCVTQSSICCDICGRSSHHDVAPRAFPPSIGTSFPPHPPETYYYESDTFSPQTSANHIVMGRPIEKWHMSIPQ